MPFTESNTVEAMIRDLLAGPLRTTAGVAETPQPYVTAGSSGRGLGWHFVPGAALPRQPQDVFVETYVREALIRLNPTIAAQPDRADEVLYKLRAIVLAVRSDGLIRANELFTAWLRGDQSMPFGPATSTSPSSCLISSSPTATSTSSPANTPSAPGPPSAGPTWSCWSTASPWS